MDGRKSMHKTRTTYILHVSDVRDSFDNTRPFCPPDPKYVVFVITLRGFDYGLPTNNRAIQSPMVIDCMDSGGAIFR